MSRRPRVDLIDERRACAYDYVLVREFGQPGPTLWWFENEAGERVTVPTTACPDEVAEAAIDEADRMAAADRGAIHDSEDGRVKV